MAVMMDKLVRVISKETIKPSSSTPSHLSPYKLSLLDQVIYPVYVPVVLFFEPNHTNTFESESNYHHLLKKSLSNVLTRYYPLAGRIKDNIFVECNDLGVDYFEAKVNGNISEFRSADLLNQLIPTLDMASRTPLIIQVNMFDCGGIAISMCMSHKLFDASSIATFINCWAATARGETEFVIPNFDAHSLFSVRQVSFPVPDTPVELKDGTIENKLVAKRFVFDAANIASLRARIAKTSNGKYPTRVEAVSALIWKSLMNPEAESMSILNQAVNLRRKMDPPLTQESFGNIVTLATTTLIPKNSYSLDELVGHLRVSIHKIDEDYVRKLRGDSGEEFIKWVTKEAGLMNEDGKNMYMMSSWCRFPFYESDFGWGKPVWVTYSVGQALAKNGIVLMDTRDGEGIEAWVKLEEKDMAAFECNENLLKFAYVTK